MNIIHFEHYLQLRQLLAEGYQLDDALVQMNLDENILGAIKNMAKKAVIGATIVGAGAYAGYNSNGNDPVNPTQAASTQSVQASQTSEFKPSYKTSVTPTTLKSSEGKSFSTSDILAKDGISKEEIKKQVEKFKASGRSNHHLIYDSGVVLGFASSQTRSGSSLEKRANQKSNEMRAQVEVGKGVGSVKGTDGNFKGTVPPGVTNVYQDPEISVFAYSPTLTKAVQSTTALMDKL